MIVLRTVEDRERQDGYMATEKMVEKSRLEFLNPNATRSGLR